MRGRRRGGRDRRLTAAALACALCAVVISGCTTASGIALTGSVVDDTVAVQMPALPTPMPDLEAGFGGGGAVSPVTAGPSRPTTIAATTGLGTIARMATVETSAGSPVRAGQLLATVDRAMLDANLAARRAASTVAREQVGVIDARLGDVASGLSTIAQNRANARSAVGQLTSTRAQLAAQLVDLRAALAKVEAALAKLPPGGLPPGVPPPAGMPNPAALKAQAAQLRTGIAKIESGSAQIDAGLAKANAGLGKLADARATALDGRTQLRDLRRLAVIAAAASKTGVDLAEYQASLSEIRSPTDGVVISIAQVGDVLAPGATVAVIRIAGPTRVKAWLAPKDAAQVQLGDTARVSSDSSAGVVSAKVTRLGERADFPPTSSATKEVHLTRAIPVELTIDVAEGSSLPPGTPVDITITPSRRE